jgi:hypothetical protein
MRKTSDARREAREPSAVPSASFATRSWTSRRRTPVWISSVARRRVDEVGRDDRAEGGLGRLLDASWTTRSCVRSWPDRAGPVDGAKDLLPEAAPHGEERVVDDARLLVLRARADLRLGEVPRDLAAAAVEELLDGVGLVGLLGEDDLPDDRLDVGVGELDLHREAVLDLLEDGRPRERRLPGRDEENARAEPLREALGEVVHLGAAGGVLADPLLDLVEDEERERELAVHVERLVDGGDHVVFADLVPARELFLQEEPAFASLSAKFGSTFRSALARTGETVRLRSSFSSSFPVFSTSFFTLSYQPCFFR